MNIKSLSFLSTCLFLASNFTAAYAVNAKPGLISARQPDGTTIEVRLSGTELHHLATTADGYPLIADENGFYMFADIDDAGEIVSTGLRATAPSERDAATKQRLASLNAEAVIDAFKNGAQQKKSAGRGVAPGLTDTFFPTTGNQKALVILVEFADRSFSMDDPHDYFYRLLNEENFSDLDATGSARDYFITNSAGLFVPDFDVFGPVKLKRDVSYYGSNDRWGYDARPQEMAIEACEALDDIIDFKDYDRNGDGIIDNVFFYYAGYGEADGGGANTIWPHSTKLSLVYNKKYMFDGVELDRYACTNELQNAIRKDYPDGIGTFCHEFCHVLGLPDLYATTYINVETPGAWDLMDNGNYNNYGLTPAGLSAYERYALGWVKPMPLRDGMYQLNPLDTSNQCFIYQINGDNEYFLFENRQQQGFDTYIPSHGMLVWLVNYDEKVWEENTVNNYFWRQHVDLIEADYKAGDGSRPGDPFPGSTLKTEFSAATLPAFKGWGDEEIPYKLIKIKESEDGIISFKAVPPHFEDDEEEEEEEPESPSFNGIDEILAEDGPVTIYSVNGIRVAEMEKYSPGLLAPGLYIAVVNGKQVKLLVR